MATIRLAMLGLLTLTAAQAQDSAALAKLREQRRELAHKPRRIVFNNDGCDALYFKRDAEFSVQAFLDARTTALADTQVDAISYCSISSGFGQFTHNTKAGALLTRQSADYGINPTMRNVTEDLIAAGTDALEAVVDYGHAHRMEVWWSMRMNDTHDSAHRPDQPYMLYPDLKAQHPEWLVGDWEQRTPHGRWSSVDYAVPEIRDLALSYLTEVAETASSRTSCGIAEFDRVMGGGVVPASSTLLGGDPGIGKSTILLQAARGLSRHGKPVLYVSGEESEAQVKLRASRLGVTDAGIYLMAETALERILSATAELSPGTLIVDSIQTVFSSDLPGAPGSVGQVRECAARLTFFGKKAGVSVFLVGHVTKEGAIAGPRVLEHIVDTVLYFEGEKGHPYRILKAVKNRFGSTNEIGVFEMRAEGLTEVADPSGMFLSERSDETSGTLVFPAIEGTRPLLVEVQSLVSQSFLAIPRRTTLGVDYNRVILMCAILEKKAGVSLYNQDVFVNVAGGIRVDEPAADLALCCAVAGSFKDRVIPPGTAVFGEVGLGGEVRAVPMAEMRLNEAAKMGFSRVVLPASNAERLGAKFPLELLPVRHVKEALSHVAGK